MGFFMSLFTLIANLFFLVGYVGVVVLLHITGWFLQKSEEEDFWEDEEMELINDFKSWIHSWPFMVAFIYLVVLAYYHIGLISMKKEDETMYYYYSNALTILQVSCGVCVAQLLYVVILCKLDWLLVSASLIALL